MQTSSRHLFKLLVHCLCKFVYTTEFMQVINQVLLQMIVSLSDEYSSDDTAQGIDSFLKQRPMS